MYTFKNVKKSELGLYINGYYDTLLAPVDPMWEETIIAKSDYYRIDEEGPIGFFAINADNVLTQFYIIDLDYEGVFSQIIKNYYITKAYVSSYDPIFRAVSDKFKLASTVNSLLYHEQNEHHIVSPLDDLVFEEASILDLEDTKRFHRDNDMADGYLEIDLTNRIDDRALILLRRNDEIIGTAEYRICKKSLGFASVAIIVDKEYRRKSIGTYILSYIKKYCNHMGFETICATAVDNIACQKTIEKSGFECYHKIYDVWF